MLEAASVKPSLQTEHCPGAVHLSQLELQGLAREKGGNTLSFDAAARGHPTAAAGENTAQTHTAPHPFVHVACSSAAVQSEAGSAFGARLHSVGPLGRKRAA